MEQPPGTQGNELETEADRHMPPTLDQEQGRKAMNALLATLEEPGNKARLAALLEPLATVTDAEAAARHAMTAYTPTMMEILQTKLVEFGFPNQWASVENVIAQFQQAAKTDDVIQFQLYVLKDKFLPPASRPGNPPLQKLKSLQPKKPPGTEATTMDGRGDKDKGSTKQANQQLDVQRNKQKREAISSNAQSNSTADSHAGSQTSGAQRSSRTAKSSDSTVGGESAGASSVNGDASVETSEAGSGVGSSLVGDNTEEARSIASQPPDTPGETPGTSGP